MSATFGYDVYEVMEWGREEPVEYILTWHGHATVKAEARKEFEDIIQSAMRTITFRQEYGAAIYWADEDDLV